MLAFVIQLVFPFLRKMMNQHHSFIKSCSQLSIFSNVDPPSETTPLLLSHERIKEEGESLNTDIGHEVLGISKPTPLPMKQMFMIGLVTFIEMIQFGMLFPFVYFMVKDFNVTDDPRQLGRYVGLIASSFSIAQFFTSLPWGWISDRVGRRPVILIGMAGNAITCILFGASKTFWFALTMRSACGLLNGTVGVTKSMIGEMTDSTNRGLAFAIWESSFGIGQIIGPAIGGLLAKPAETLPDIFGNSDFFKEYP